MTQTINFERAAVQDAYEEFIMRAHSLADDGIDVCSVLTPAVIERNTAIAQGWGMENLPGGLASANNSGWWELAFAACIQAGLLTSDPNYISKKTRIALFQEFERTLPVAIHKAIFENQLDQYAQKLSAEQSVQLARLGGPKAFRQFVNGGF